MMVSDGNMNVEYSVVKVLWYQKFVTSSRPSSWRIETDKIIDFELISWRFQRLDSKQYILQFEYVHEGKEFQIK